MDFVIRQQQQSVVARRRGAGFSPADISGLQLWLKADAITGLNDGDAVTTWSDSSGNARNFAQGTGANQPSFETNELNGKPVVRFNGTSDFMDAGDTLGFERTDSFTIFYVAKETSGGEASVLAKMDRGASYRGYAVGNSNGNGNVVLATLLNAVTTNGLTETYAAITPGAFQIVAVTYAGTSAPAGLTAYKNGTEATGTVAQNNLTATIATTALLALGARVNSNRSNVGEYNAMDLAELLVYDSVLSQADLDRVETYFSDKYGITVS